MSKSLYSWVIVGISFANIATAYGLRFSFSIFFVAILEEFGWSRACTAGAFSLSALLLGVGSWLAGRLVDRLGSRKILVGGVIILSFSTFASGWIQEVWHLYAFFGVLGALGGCGLGWVPHSVLLSDWFIQRRGTMVGIAFSGMGAGILILGPVSQFLISSFGWRIAYMILGSMVLIFLMPLNCMVRNRPSEKNGLSTPYRPNPTTTVQGVEESEAPDWTLDRAIRTLPFWCLALAFFLLPLGIFPIIVHQVAYIVDHFGNIYGFINIGNGIGGALGPWLAGYLYDATGSYEVSFLACIPILVVSCVLFWMAGWSRRRKKGGNSEKEL
jgi:MFS family permease